MRCESLTKQRVLLHSHTALTREHIAESVRPPLRFHPHVSPRPLLCLRSLRAGEALWTSRLFRRSTRLRGFPKATSQAERQYDEDDDRDGQERELDRSDLRRRHQTLLI